MKSWKDMNVAPSIDEEKRKVDLLCLGDRQSGKVFLEQYGGLIRSIVLSMDIHSSVMDHDDLFMEVLAHIFKDQCKVLRTFEWKSKLSTYLYLIARRYVLDITARENRISSKMCAQTNTDDLAAECEMQGEELNCDEAHRAAFHEALEALDSKDALFIRMLVIEKKTTEEVKKIFGWNSENTVYARKNKVIAKLRSLSRKALQRKGIV
jgi:RNA polymerase sigma factor (sigma-70 family)